MIVELLVRMLIPLAALWGWLVVAWDFVWHPCYHCGRHFIDHGGVARRTGGWFFECKPCHDSMWG